MAEVSPKAWIVNAMNTKPGIMNARSWIQAIRKLNLRRTKNRIQSRSMVRLCHGQNAWDRACTEMNASRTKMGSRGTKAQLTHDKGCAQSKSMGWLCHGHSPSYHETPKAEFRQDKLKIKHLQGCLGSGRRQFFKHEEAIACTLGISPNHNPRGPTTVFSGLQRGPK